MSLHVLPNTGFSQTTYPKRQHGAALIVSLILLAVITMVGITSMQSTNLEMKMVSSARERSEAFAAAESALVQIEEQLISSRPHISTFNSTCAGGFCFSGTIDTDMHKYLSCGLQENKPTGATKHIDYWEMDSVWDETLTTPLHQTISVDVSKDGSAVSKTVDVKYIVEFLCFSPVNDEAMRVSAEDTSGGEAGYTPIVLVTALSESNSGRGRAFVQSTVRLNDRKI